MFAASENTSVWGVVSGNELHKGNSASGMSLLNPVNWHGIGDHVEGFVHVLLKETLEFVTNKESLGSMISVDALPDHCLLASSGLCLVIRSIQVLDMGEVRASLMTVVLRASELFGLSSGDSCDQKGLAHCKFHYDLIYLIEINSYLRELDYIISNRAN